VTTVVFDDDIFSSQLHGGISRYFTELICAFLEEGDDSPITPQWPAFSMSAFPQEAGITRRLRPTWVARRPGINAANRVVETAQGLTARKAPHIVHHTFYRQHYLSRYSSAQARVSTLYDFIPELFPTDGKGSRHWAKEQFIRASDALLCISETTKNDLLRIYGDVGVPVVVTPLAVSARFTPTPTRNDRLFEGEYVLFVGGRDAYKSFDVMLAAFSLVAADTEANLVAVGAPPTEAEQVRLDELGLRDRVRFARLSDADLVTAYQQALVFVFPSAYEGFGLPTLEAMACGCPVVTSTAPALVEVGGDATLRFEAGDADALAAQLRAVLGDGALRSTLVRRGLERSAEFSWARTARQTAACYTAITQA
jgi:glycosyltransferase involved in cell wall biosynthesis